MKVLILATLLCCCYFELALADNDNPGCLKALFGRGHGINLMDGVEKLNEYLVQNVQSADVDSNLAAAAKIADSSEDSSLAEAGKQFASINKDNLCNEQTINAVYTLNNALDNPLSESSLMPQKRINSIVYQLRKEVSECHDTFLEIVEAKNKQMDPVQFGRVKTFVDGAYAKYLGDRKSLPSYVFYSPERILSISINIIGQEHAEILYEAMVKLSKEDGDPLSGLVNEKTGKYKESGLKKLVNKYIVDPCEHHNQFFSRHLFAPIFDGKFSSDMTSKPEDMAYYMSFVRYSNCMMLLNTIKNEKREGESHDIYRKIQIAAEH